MKRGLISFILVFLLALPLLQLAHLQATASEATSFYKNKVLFLEKKRAVELDVKNCFRQVFWSAKGMERREVVEDVVTKLVALESFVEKHYQEKEVEIDLWFGALDERETASLKKRMLSRKKPIKCSRCLDLNAKTIDLERNIVPKAMAFLDADTVSKKISVSRNGFAFVPEAAAEWFLGRIGFGASIYFPRENASAIIFLPEGFSEQYGEG